jgi:hypothetical protein
MASLLLLAITKRNFHTLLKVVILRYQPETPLGETIRYISLNDKQPVEVA